jgi:hypothetical protein
MLLFRRHLDTESLMAHAITPDYRGDGSCYKQFELLQEAMNTKEGGPNSLEKSNLNPRQLRCSADFCPSESMIVLGEQPLCLPHFLTHCYEWLDQLDPIARDRFISPDESARVRRLVEECSNRALLVSLRCETLTNLDRSRLLDILLRSSDLLFLLCLPADVNPWLPAYPPVTAKPQRQKTLSLGSQLHSNKSYGY